MKIKPEPPKDCQLCPRLVAFREDSAQKNPDWFAGAVPSFGDEGAELLVLGLAPGLQGAHRTGRPFTGDYAGHLLYETLTEYDWANGKFDARIDDGLKLSGAMVSNAVRCVPPQNKPIGEEVNTCRPFMLDRIAALKNLKAILCLGRIAHDTLIRGLGARLKDYPFAHQARHDLDGLMVFDSYHCSRYNTNTGRLTPEMFRAVFADIRAAL
ncbi:uracil-DNA glycosylase [Paracoccaceae bacterium GXU_MW_L88]